MFAVYPSCQAIFPLPRHRTELNVFCFFNDHQDCYQDFLMISWPPVTSPLLVPAVISVTESIPEFIIMYYNLLSDFHLKQDGFHVVL